MQEKFLVLHIPVVHRGYLDLFKSTIGAVSAVYVIDEKLLEELAEFKPDIASLATAEAENILKNLGFQNIRTLSLKNISELKNKRILLIQDEISKHLSSKYLQGENIEWVSVFLRWDKSKVLAEMPLQNVRVSDNSFDIAIMKEAYKEAQKSGDWWRQVGAVLVNEGQIVFRAYNQGLPSDHTPYQVGNVRDFFQAGEKQELANTIHAEQKIIAEAAKKGIALEGTAIYVTHFTCPVCAKSIAFSGIKNVYFSEGASALDGKKILESAGVKITQVKIDSKF